MKNDSISNHLDSIDKNFRIGQRYLVFPLLNRIRVNGSNGRDSIEVKLEPRLMHVLKLLAIQPGKVLSRDFLIETVWENKYVGEEALTQAISRLRKVFQETAHHPTVIQTISKKGYRLVQPVEFVSANNTLIQSNTPDPDKNKTKPITNQLRKPSRTKLFLWAGLVIICIVAGFKFYVPEPDPASFLLNAVAVTSEPGLEIQPALSPRGDFVAFSKRHRDNGTLDIFVKATTTPEIRQLTDNDADNTNAVWSPDGSLIAYAQLKDGYSDLHIISAAGGKSKKLIRCGLETTPTFDWHPQGSQMALSDRITSAVPYRIYAIDTATLERTSLTNPPGSILGDIDPVFSADGTRLAFKRMYTSTTGDIYTMDISEGETLQVTRDAQWIGGLSWFDNSNLIYTSSKGSFRSAWRVSERGGEPVWLGGENMYELTVARAGKTVAFSSAEQNIDIWALDVESGKNPRQAIQILTSTKKEWAPSVSVQGDGIAYLSNESGHFEVWLSDLTGAEKKMLTSLKKKAVSKLSWSPHGNSIAFTVVDNGKYFIMSVPREHGLPKTLIRDHFNNRHPVWSPDGKSIYFASDRKDGWQIWKKSLSDDSLNQITFAGGLYGQASPDGRFFYFTRPEFCGLWRMPAEGRQAELILEPVAKSDFKTWQLADTGIYFIERKRHPAPTISFFDLSTKEITPVMPLPKSEGQDITFSVSPQEVLYFTKTVQSESDIMLVRL